MKATFGMLGPNGVGKSTIFNLITGLVNPDKGRIKIVNEDVTKYLFTLEQKIQSSLCTQYGGFLGRLSSWQLKAISEIVIEKKFKIWTYKLFNF